MELFVSVAMMIPLAIAQEADVPSLAVQAVEYLNPPITLFPLTNNGTTVRIPDLSRTFSLLYRTPNFTAVLSDQAIDLLNTPVALSDRTQALYDIEKLFGHQPNNNPDLLYFIIDQIYNPINLPIVSKRWTTLGGSSMWFWPAWPIMTALQCDCRNLTIMPTNNALDLRTSVDNILTVEAASGMTAKSVRNAGCSPRVLAQARLRLRPYYGDHVSPVVKDVLHAQFNMIVDVLKIDTAVPILESIKIGDAPIFKVKVEDDQIGARIMSVARLPAAAVGNMRGLLTVRQYALYQALRRGDSDCPVPVTDCGKAGPDRCDSYP